MVSPPSQARPRRWVTMLTDAKCLASIACFGSRALVLAQAKGTPMGTTESSPAKRPQKRGHRVARRIAFGVVFVALAGVVWGIFFPHETKTSGPVSLDRAQDCPIPLPPSARNIQFYKWYPFNFFIEFVRFEAPVEDCMGHVETVLAVWRKDFDYLSDLPKPVSDLEEPPRLHAFAKERGVAWFDPHSIRKGVSASGGGSGVPMIWVDTERGVFYYMLTD